jgi:hypothetical protein
LLANEGGVEGEHEDEGPGRYNLNYHLSHMSSKFQGTHA